MSVIVDNNATFKICFRYREVMGDDGNAVGVTIVPDEEFQDSDTVFWAEFAPCSFDVMMEAKADATVINHINEKSLLQYRLFIPLILSRLCKSWSLVYPDGTQVPISPEVIGGMYDNFAEEIFTRWCRASGHNPVKEVLDEDFQRFYEQMIEDLTAAVMIKIKYNVDGGANGQ